MSGKHNSPVSRDVATDFDSYEDFYDLDWVGEQSKCVPAQLHDQFQNLCWSWRDASNTHRSPHLLMRMMAAFANTHFRNRKIHGRLAVEAIQKDVLGKLDATFTAAHKKKIKAVIKDLEHRMRVAEQQTQVRIRPEDFWEHMFEEKAFPLTIIGPQNLALCGQVFAYETFMFDCYQALGGEYQMNKGDKFWTDFGSLLGPEARLALWDDPPLFAAREVRNSFAHRGGRASQKLLASSHKPRIGEDGIIAVTSIYNHEVARLLRRKVELLLDIANDRIRSNDASA